VKANEFVKEFGWLKACDIVAHIPDRFMSCYYDRVCYCTKYKKYSDRFQPRITLVNIADLKRLTESWELVASWGGLADAEVAVKVSRHKKYLKRAIADVESCMEVASESN